MMQTITPHKSECKTLVIDEAADVSASQLDLLKKDSRFKQAWERKLRVKDNSVSACEAIIAERAVWEELDDQTICNLLIASKRYHGDDFVSEADYYTRAIAHARNAYERARLLNSNENLSREEALRQLSFLLTVEVTSIQRFLTDPRSYVMMLANGSYVEFKTSSELLSQAKLSGALVDYANVIMPSFKSKEWDKVTSLMPLCMEDVESSVESTYLGSCIAWLRTYLRRHLRLDMEHEGQMKAAMEGKPAIIDEAIWFPMDGFKRSILMESGEQPPKTVLAVRLEQIGCVYEKRKALRVGEFHTTRSLWRAPNDFLSDEEVRSL
jgi:hypothetical protein